VLSYYAVRWKKQLSIGCVIFEMRHEAEETVEHLTYITTKHRTNGRITTDEINTWFVVREEEVY
jgi:hypothetical protein